MPRFVKSSLALRIYWTSKEMGEPFEISPDPVTDFLVKEAIMVRVGQERRKEEKRREREDWKRQVK